MKIKGKRLLLLLMYSPTDKKETNIPISGRTRLMKMAFLFKEEMADNFRKIRNIDEFELPEFYAWNYGPFSRDLLNDLEFLINNGLVKVNIGNENSSISAEIDEYKRFEYWVEDLSEYQVNEYDEEIFCLTEKGIEKAVPIWNELNARQKSTLKEFKNILVKATLDRILRYVYKKYEEQGYTDNSLIREKYLS